MRIRIVDAFTDRPFAGNQAAVVLLPKEPFPDDLRLQRIAAEMNLSETAFARPLPGGADAEWALRWFTPTTEVDLCGHATLAAAHVLHTAGAVTGTVRFVTRSGLLTASTGYGTITLDFPTAPLSRIDAPPEVASALNVPVRAAYGTGPQVGDLLVEVEDENAVRSVCPDLPAVARLPYRGLIVTAQAGNDDRDGNGDGGAPEGGYDYVSRFFAPRVGIDEDPVTGSAHTALAPLWSGRLGRDQLTGLQVSSRTGVVRTTVRGDRTLLTGSAVTVLDGSLLTGV